MAGSLDAIPGGEQSAARTRELIRVVRATQSELADVWRAVEWWRSNDWGLDQVTNELVVYNERRDRRNEQH